MRIPKYWIRQEVRDYDRASGSKATCQFVETIGSDAINPDVSHIVKLHDDRTRATSSLPLA